jgi:glycerophosphoryl diester phosphodiesterase
LLAAATEASATPLVQAHRGGSVLDGVPSFPEDTMPAFENAAREQVVLELDVKLTKDDVPVVIHDDTPDRTTTCDEGRRVRDYTLAELRGCRADVLGSPGSDLPTAPVANPTVGVPTLAEVLALARRTGARVNLEIKNLPTDNDYDPSGAYAATILDGVTDSGLPLAQLIVQSFEPVNLEVAKQRLPGAETSLLTLAPTNEGGPSFAKSRGYDWISPGFPVSQQYVSEAHALGLRVVPYTLNTPEEVRGAAAVGVDELITDDLAMARRVLAELESPAPAIPPPPSAADCAVARASRQAAPIETFAPAVSAPRVFAMQFKQELRHVETYATFRTKIECMVRELVLPRIAPGRPNVVALNEDVGLMTIATGSRGAVARAAFGGPGKPSCESAGVPCTTLGALGAVTVSYSQQNAAYRARFDPTTPVSDAFVAATDTFARGWMQVFSDIARRYDVYILGSNNQAPFRESTDPAEIDIFRDPDLPRPDSVFVATTDEVFNEVFMWGPDDVRPDGPRPLRNVVARNKKVPLTPIEDQLQLSAGPSTGPDAVPNVAPYTLPGTQARISFATSLPAFVYGDPPAGVDPCSDTALYYMRCLDRLGTNLVMQDEANPGRWAGQGGGNYWQPLEWMRSTWRAAADPEVSFAYNVTPHMVGNLADLAFDGQTAITQRGLGAGSPDARRCTYVGNAAFVPGEDPEAARGDAGPKREFLAIVPWVAPDGPRGELRAVGAKLAPGSGDALENDYVETAIAADLPFPPRSDRRGCAVAASSTAPTAGDPPEDERGGGGPEDRRDDEGEDPAERGDGAGAGDTGALPFTGFALAFIAGAGLLCLAAGTGLRRRAG